VTFKSINRVNARQKCHTGCRVSSFKNPFPCKIMFVTDARTCKRLRRLQAFASQTALIQAVDDEQFLCNESWSEHGSRSLSSYTVTDWHDYECCCRYFFVLQFSIHLESRRITPHFKGADAVRMCDHVAAATLSWWRHISGIIAHAVPAVRQRMMAFHIQCSKCKLQIGLIVTR
jgi:hypothetical protein